MPYSPNKSFAYPQPYNPKQSLELYIISELQDAPAEITQRRDLFTASSRTLLTHYSESHLGQWHTEQTPRYPKFHKDMPDSVVPDVFRNQPQKFGREWLKNFVAIGHLNGVLEDNPSTTETRFPMFDTSDIHEPSDTQASDLHPIGHMIRTSVMLDETLARGEHSPYTLSPYATYLTRSAMALHDIGENEHPGVIVETGETVGDIAATTGKTAADRAQERKILESILAEEFADYFDPEMREIISALVGHRTHGLGSEYTNAHSIQEIAHNLNSARTGIFAANLAVFCANVLARNNDDDDQGIYLIGHSMAMAEQHVKVLSKKFEEVREETPKLYDYFNDVIIGDAMALLAQKAHALDQHESFVRWRTSEPMVAHYGEYQPTA
jgi:hypothetical protein